MKASYILVFVGALTMSACSNTDKQSSSAPEQNQSTDAEQEQGPPKALAWLLNANSRSDAHGAITRQDYRLLAISGRGTRIPGVDMDQMQQARQQCRLRFLKGAGDVVRGKNELKWRNKAKQYAAEYNRIMIKYCLVDDR